jgi:hypothetical protein
VTTTVAMLPTCPVTVTLKAVLFTLLT